ncbi:MAG: phage tail length tape measure family protein [Rhodocyclaceae bacterium]|nr:phage tail length tape measure family protein [Rhodocyclaceae bacterium]
MTDRQMNVSLSLRAEGGAATAAEVEKVKTSLAGVGTAAEQAGRKVEQSSKQAAFAMHQLPMQMTDIVTGLASGQSPFMVLVQQGGQLKDMFGGIGPAITAVGGYVAGLVNPFTVAIAAAAALGYGLVRAFDDAEEPAKNLKTAVGDLDGAIGDVGKVARDVSMDNLYREFNKASAGAREGYVEQIRFQQALIETQNLLAQKSLSQSLGGLGEYGFADKMKGAFAETGAEKLARELGVSRDVAADLLPAIWGLRNGSEDAGNFMARFGVELARSNKGAAQQLVRDIKAVAEGSRDAAAAQSRLSEALQKMQAAGSNGQIAATGRTQATKAAGPIDVFDNGSFIARDKATAQAIRESYEFENWAWGEIAKDRERAAKEAERMAGANERSNQALIAMTTGGKLAALAEQQDRAANLLSEGRIDFEGYDEIINRLGGIRDAGEDTFGDLTRAVEGWGKAASSAFVDFAFTGKGSFSDLVAHMLREAATMMVYESLFKPLFGELGSFLKTSLPSFGGGRASGGSVYPGEYYVVGENGPEILVPGASGTVIPNRGGGGMASGGNVSVSVAVDASGSNVAGGGGQAAELGSRIAAAVRSVLIDEKRPGGLLAA